MKKIHILLLLSLLVFGCKKHKEEPKIKEEIPTSELQEGTIRGKVNGEMKSFTFPIPIYLKGQYHTEYSHLYRTTYQKVHLQRKEFESQEGNQWRIYLSDIDLDKIKLPLTLSKNIEGAPYAEIQWRLNDDNSGPLYIGALFYNNIVLTINSLEQDRI